MAVLKATYVAIFLAGSLAGDNGYKHTSLKSTSPRRSTGPGAYSCEGEKKNETQTDSNTVPVSLDINFHTGLMAALNNFLE